MSGKKIHWEVPYRSFPVDPDDRARGAFIRPCLPVSISSGAVRISTLAIVDSGADHCIFPISFAHALGIDILQAKAEPTCGVGSHSVPTYFWDVLLRLKVDGIQEETTRIGFTEGLEHLGFGVLGHNGFFDRYKVMFEFAKGLWMFQRMVNAEA